MSVDYDSILVATDSNVINRTEYYAVGKGLPDHGVPMVGRPYSVANDDYIIGGVLFILLMLALVLYNSRWTLLYKIKEFFTTKRQYSDENINSNSSDATNVFILTTICSLSLGLMFFKHLADQGAFDPVLGIPYWLFAGCYILFIVFIYAKAWIYTLVNWTFFDHESSSKWISSYFMLTSLMAFLLVPVSLIDLFIENSKLVVAICYFSLFVLYEILLFFRLFAIFMTKKYGYMLIFLYFCSVEIMPAIVLAHTLSMFNGNILFQNLLY